MKLSDKIIIEQENLIIVEGMDDENFISVLLNYLDIENVEIVNIEGNNFRDYVPEIGKITGFDKVKILIIISDADNNANTAFNRIKRSIEQIEDYDLIPPNNRNTFNTERPMVGIYIITKGDSEEGMLEDLCLETIKHNNVMECVDSFSDCISNLGIELRNPAKSKCQTFLSAMPESVPHIGIAAQRGFWELNSEALDELKLFLSNLKS
ncbi:MAG: hypothetical protein GF317_17425 [Candidatus Lokiarchaeota archaeon]|nr:hypothetical protein [Candidatus Lokiarchaeota archaeon]MBD3201301.1 hypothetical protein [Candidatus Lokiarchaeota archaeon]